MHVSRHHARLPAHRVARLAAFVKGRDGYRCRLCGRPGRLEADHIQPLDKGGAAWDPDNMQALCRPCHFAKTRAERRPPPDPERELWRAHLFESTRDRKSP